MDAQRSVLTMAVMTSPLRRALLAAACSAALLAVAPASALAQENESNVSLPRYPSISPAGDQIVFSFRGDLWAVGLDGGFAQRLTNHPGNELQSRFNADGSKVAFSSDRRGTTGLYTMNSDGTGVDEVLVVDRASLITDFADDGNLYFTGYLEPDVYRAPRPYHVDSEGGVHMRVHDAFGRSPVKEPGGERILFVRGDESFDRRGKIGPDTRDVWLYEANGEDGGTFTQLTTWRGNDGMPRWAGEGRFVFMSNREDDVVNLYLADADDGEGAGENARRLTNFTDRDIDAFDVTPDGNTLVFSRWDSLYTLDLADENAEPRRIDVRAAEDEGDRVKYVTTDSQATDAAVSPDGKTIATVAYGQVYVRATDERAPTRRLTDDAARYTEVAWSPDGGTLYFVGNPDGREAIYAATVELNRSAVKEAVEAAAKEGEDVPASQPATEPATQPATQPDEEPEALAWAPDPSKWSDAISFRVETVVADAAGSSGVTPAPDGKRIAYMRGMGDLVVLDLETGDDTLILDGWDRGLSMAWSPDGKHVLYETSDADFNSDIWATRADGTGYRGEGEPVNVTRHPDNDGSFSMSADGRVLAFISERVNEEYDVWMVMLDEELETLTPQETAGYYEELAKNVKKLKPIDVPAFAKARGTVSPLVEDPATRPATQPASRPAGEGASVDVNVGGEKGLTISLSIGKPDEPTTQPTTQPGEGETMAEGDPSPVDIADLDDLALDTAYLRLQRVSRESGNEFNAFVLPDASAIYYQSGGSLYKKPWDGSASAAGGSASIRGSDVTGATLTILAGGRGGTQLTNSSNKRETFATDDRLEVDLAEESERKFRELATTLGDQFYHPTMKDLDWPALIDAYAPLARNARTGDEFEHVAMKLLGELNASHLGVTAPGTDRPARQNLGRLGVRTVPVEQGFEVVEVLETGPAGRGDFKIEVGDVITKLELEPVDMDKPLEVQLPDKVNREVVVTVLRGGAERNLLLTPVSYGSISGESYDSWRLAKLREVEELSGGRLGYIHIQAMNQSSLDVFERDLYAAAHGKEGLLIDVRNNGGGSTTDRVLASIMYPRHAYTIPRGMREGVDAGRANLERGGYPQDRLFIQRYSLPINMLCNENSFSNAEIISHAFKQLGRGTLVGEETAGGVISTGAFSLVDGTRVRLPFRGWYLMDGRDMENNGAMPDIRVAQTPEAEVAGEDEQLKAAVEDLMQRLDAEANAE